MKQGTTGRGKEIYDRNSDAWYWLDAVQGGAMIVNKTDVLPYFDFDLDKVTEFARQRNPGMQIFPISAKTGEGVEALAAWICAQICKEKEKKETRL